jgi:hypothetical protein
MFLTEEEREVLKRILERLLTPAAAPKVAMTLREARELRRKAEEDGQKKG